jgi:glycine cleavage system H protein
MPEWKNVKVRQELLEQVEKELQKTEQLPSLSEFVSEAIQLRLEAITKERVSEYLEREKQNTTVIIQGQRYFTPKHIWASLTPQGNVRLGVSEYFPSQLTAIVYVETGKIGEIVTKDMPFGVVETVGGWPFVIHDIYSPIEGEIIKVNKEVIDDPYVLNGDSYQWIVEIQPSNPEHKKELEELLSFEEYKKLS